MLKQGGKALVRLAQRCLVEEMTFELLLRYEKTRVGQALVLQTEEATRAEAEWVPSAAVSGPFGCVYLWPERLKFLIREAKYHRDETDGQY